MTDLQKTEFNMLEAFISACDQLGLKYYLLGGTLLGAVRHRGFIPWDDDIDVGMLREDYEIFLREGQKLLPPHLFLQTYLTDPEFLQPFAKLRNSNTTFIEQIVQNKHINHGVFIDIFPLDYYPESRLRRRFYAMKKRMFLFRQHREFYLPDEKKLTFNKILFTLPSLLMYPTSQSFIRSFEKTVRSYPPSDHVCNYCGAWGDREAVPASWFGEGSWGEFEGLRVRLPKEPDKYLTNIYGDYMQLPPAEERVARHVDGIVDLSRSYREYLS